MKGFRIALAGRSGAGKDTAAAILAKYFNFRQHAFADPVKEAVAAAFPLFDFSKYGKNDPIPELGGKSQRELWQSLGTEWGRNLVYPNIWVDGLLRKVRRVKMQHPNHNPSFIVTDVRFESEAYALLHEGFHIVKVVRPGVALSGRLSDHISENGIDDLFCHETLQNDGDLAALEAAALAIVGRLQG